MVTLALFWTSLSGCTSRSGEGIYVALRRDAQGFDDARKYLTKGTIPCAETHPPSPLPIPTKMLDALKGLVQSAWFVICGVPPDAIGPTSSRSTLEARLYSISQEIAYRVSVGEHADDYGPIFSDEVLRILWMLVKFHELSMGDLHRLVVADHILVWLYSVPVPAGKVATNPRTHFQKRYAVRVYLGLHTDFTALLLKMKIMDAENVAQLADAGFEEDE